MIAKTPNNRIIARSVVWPRCGDTGLLMLNPATAGT